MYAVHYLLGVAAAALVGFALGAMIRGIAAHVTGPRNVAEAEKTTRRSSYLSRIVVGVGAPLAMVGLWLFAVTVDLETWGQPVLGANAVLGAAVGWWAGPALSDAFTTRPAYRPGQGRRAAARRCRPDDETGAPADPLSFRDDDSPP